MKRKRIFIILIIFIFLGYISYNHYQNLQVRKKNWLLLKQVVESDAGRFKGMVGIVIKDLNMNWEFSINKDRLFPSASLAKIPIMLACFQANKEGKINLEDTIKLKGSDKVSGSGVLKDMPAGRAFTIGKLIELMVCNSDNTAANVLIDRLGFDYLNDYFKKSGLKNTNLSRKMMDFKYRRNGVENYTTPADMAYILEKIYRKKILSGDRSKKCLKLLRQQKINDRIPAKLPPSTIVAHKTGLEQNVCHDAGIVYTPKGNFLICVLTKNAKSNRIAKEFISKVTLDVYNYYSNQLLLML